jgi:hypothetical protein
VLVNPYPAVLNGPAELVEHEVEVCRRYIVLPDETQGGRGERAVRLVEGDFVCSHTPILRLSGTNVNTLAEVTSE